MGEIQQFLSLQDDQLQIDLQGVVAAFPRGFACPGGMGMDNDHLRARICRTRPANPISPAPAAAGGPARAGLLFIGRVLTLPRLFSRRDLGMERGFVT